MAGTGLTIETVAECIHVVRRQRVMLDADLAELYGVTTKRLNEQVKRNRRRFPRDFMFQLTVGEDSALRSQIATSNTRRGGRRHRAHAFTEHGAIMAATVLNSSRAVSASILVVRAFVQLRRMLVADKAVAAKLKELENRLSGHDKAIGQIVLAIRRLMASPLPARRGIGFTADF